MRRSSTFKVFLVALIATPVAAQRAPVSAPRPIATVKQLHDILITPASDVVFHASVETPTTSKAWLDAHDHALMLAEAGNLLMLGTRARDKDQWMKMSRALVDAAALAATATEKKDARALEAATDSVTVACEACHRPYRDQGRQMGVPAR
jgi:hypothetical protein